MKSPRTNPDVFRDSQKTRSLRTRPKWTNEDRQEKGPRMSLKRAEGRLLGLRSQ